MLEQALLITFNHYDSADRFDWFDPARQEFLSHELARFMTQYGESLGAAAFELAYRPGPNPERVCQILTEQIATITETEDSQETLKSISALIESLLIRTKISKIGF